MEVYSVKLNSKKVIIENTNGEQEEYTIHEMNGDKLEDYLNEQREKVIIKDGSAVVNNYKGIYSSLLRLTMTGPDDKDVSLALIKTWPSRVQKALFEEAQKLNALNEGADEEAKND